MILVIDTSSTFCAMAAIDPRGVKATDYVFPARQASLADRLGFMLDRGDHITKVAVATGPGSFTGLRVGVSFGLGLAIGLEVPIVPLPTLALQAARCAEPVLAVSEAGRGRVYYLPPGGGAAIGEPADLPADHEVVGWLRPETQRSLTAAGLRFCPDDRLRPFHKAAAIVLEKAREVPYGSLKLEYMQSFGVKR